MQKNTDPRHNSRRVCLSVFFCLMHNNIDINQCLETSLDALELTNNDIDTELFENIFNGVKKHQQEIDEIISSCAKDWPIDKIAKIDLILLRMGIFEILYYQKTPDKVVVDEAVELAKEFGSDSSSKFVNGVLGTVIEIKNG